MKIVAGIAPAGRESPTPLDDLVVKDALPTRVPVRRVPLNAGLVIVDISPIEWSYVETLDDESRWAPTEL